MSDIDKITSAMPSPDATCYVTRQGDNDSTGRCMDDVAYCPSDSPFAGSDTSNDDD